MDATRNPGLRSIPSIGRQDIHKVWAPGALPGPTGPQGLPCGWGVLFKFSADQGGPQSWCTACRGRLKPEPCPRPRGITGSRLVLVPPAAGQGYDGDNKLTGRKRRTVGTWKGAGWWSSSPGRRSRTAGVQMIQYETCNCGRS